MRVYKSVTSKLAVLNMAQGSLKFTPIDELNDPSEFTPVTDRDAATIRLLRAKVGVLSPSERFDSLPMRAHHANHAALNACRRSADGSLYLRDVSPDQMTGMICGCRVHAASLREELAHVNPGTILVSADMDGGRVRVGHP
jgi:hypothetical protein